METKYKKSTLTQLMRHVAEQIPAGPSGENELFLSGSVLVVELVVLVSQRCTEMALVSWFAEQEVQMLLLCHLHLAVTTSASPLPGRQVRRLGSCCMFAPPSFSVCPAGPIIIPRKSIHGFKVALK